MRAALVALVLGNVALAVAVWATQASEVGSRRWHHDLAYAGLVLACLSCVRLLRRRRVTTLLLASLGAWSLLTGLFLVYVTPEVGRGRWMSWWHGATSMGFALAFLAHWARNNARLIQLARRLSESSRAWGLVAGAWIAVGLLAVASVASPLSALFTDRRFWDLSTLTFLLVLAALVGAALIGTDRAFRRRLAQAPFRNRLRGAVDVSLLAMAWLAILTGFPLLYFARDLRAADAYWLVAGWHVVASALLVGLVAVHVGFNARPLRAHAR